MRAAVASRADLARDTDLQAGAVDPGLPTRLGDQNQAVVGSRRAHSGEFPAANGGEDRSVWDTRACRPLLRRPVGLLDRTVHVAKTFAGVVSAHSRAWFCVLCPPQPERVGMGRGPWGQTAWRTAPTGLAVLRPVLRARHSGERSSSLRSQIAAAPPPAGGSFRLG